ncbi:hypothetical protein PsYK624_135010 [Phanerochaete sordida]|uniref:Uncharacterized protein n=1 Tax=Phanerochaete sordida TaxID=48140 RepID=A0A9P3LJD9_9APHY|nr:hypothetical protein PsYK624_135010 [Phanerochaete sordida]
MPIAEEHGYGNLSSISAVYSFTRRVVEGDGTGKEVEVEVIVVYNSPMEAILTFHSTAVLNIISYSHAYSLYPRVTFENRLMLLLLPDRRIRPAVKEKYKDRGYTLLRHVPMLLPTLTGDGTGDVVARQRARDRSVARCFLAGLRWIGDRHSWVLPLRADGAALLPPSHGECGATVSRDPCAVTTWEVVVEGALERRIRAETLEPLGFGQSYIVTDPQLQSAMSLIHELYVDVPWLAHGATQYCHEEFMCWCKRMLEDEWMWETWYSAGSAQS